MLAIVLGWFAYSLLQPFAGDGEGEIRVQIPAGASVEDIGDILSEQGVIDSPLFFSLRATLEGERGALRSGTYTMKRDMSYSAAITALTTPPPVKKITTFDVTLPEGLTRDDMNDVVKDSPVRGNYLAASKSSPLLAPASYGAPGDTDSLEGFLFPSTYELKKAATAKNLVEKQVRAFKAEFAKLDMGFAEERGYSKYDVVIIASMIQREAGGEQDMRQISQVIWTRLENGEPLGIDATTRYELDNWDEPLTESELASDTPYNTRLNSGLPPTPIGNPGAAALAAAAKPANTDYCCYIADPDKPGEHRFQETYDEFLQDQQEYYDQRGLNE